jgi:hypothetical protein
MAEFRNVFFSFHYKDVMLASQIRNCDMFFGDRMSFRDWANWEQVRLRSKPAIASWIDDQLEGTSVTVVLIGDETATREWVHYEIAKSVQRNNGLVGIYLNRMRAPRHTGTAPRGDNPFKYHRPRNAIGSIIGTARNPSSKEIGNALRNFGLLSSPPPAPQRNALRDIGLLASALSPSSTGFSLDAVRKHGFLGLGAQDAPSAPSFSLDSFRKQGLFADVGIESLPPPPPPSLAQQVGCYC